ncbi:histone H4 transcription factor [Microplitis demolitor]|uniref:histone H4 transcription factor n=1 Tax=Microplitis demolitor TaxID=69319 RepID=UPI0004CD8CBD|nr:histone H4 transcription factor [Microplitis demolitor]XP_014300456.1 histone H4 transcription factor [Microplitis demolitor]XP_014300457.1 histone H4 transcription factor [Microplitis demolitor]
MASSITEYVKNQEIQERCNQWVTQSILSSSTLSNSNKRDRDKESDFDVSECFDTDSEFDSVSECGGKKRRLKVHLKKEVLNLICEWKDCQYTSTDVERYVHHVANHVSDLDVKILSNINNNYNSDKSDADESNKNNEDNEDDQDDIDDKGVYVCKWKHCQYENDSIPDIIKHVNYHSYHTKLKCIGSNIRARIKLPKCHREMIQTVFHSSTPLFCNWEECLKLFNNFQLFLYHVGQHVESNPRGNNVSGGIECLWTGCKRKFPSIHKLKDHIKCHTKEKVVACPTCGAVFASNTKLFDHCRRQISIETQGFQCSYCTKFYPTENILREHMRFHVFKYKCSLCDMSCESPAALAKHVRYRHVSTRQFSCQLCEHAAKSQQDLDSHMTVHTNGHNFFCNNDGCSYTCKNAYVLDRHIERVHRSEVRWYCCHECPIKYRRSYNLTKHLIGAHNLRWPDGHKRFQYTRVEDGCYRLQMVRYECIDEEDDARDSIVQESELPQKDYKIKVNTDSGIPNYIIMEDNGDDSNAQQEVNTDVDDNVGKSMPTLSNILISIDEVDEHGNIINRQVIETQETKTLPSSDEPPVILGR